jgi:fluoride exporter
VVITILLVLTCGGVAALARFAVDSLVQRRRSGEFPLGTLVVNAAGCLLLGLLVGLHASKHAMTLIATATLGSYTTFSTWMLETHRPAQDGERSLAWRNILISFIAGLVAIVLGRLLGGAL